MLYVRGIQCNSSLMKAKFTIFLRRELISNIASDLLHEV